MVNKIRITALKSKMKNSTEKAIKALKNYINDEKYVSMDDLAEAFLLVSGAYMLNVINDNDLKTIMKELKYGEEQSP